MTSSRSSLTHRVGRSLRERRGPPATVDNALFDAIQSFGQNWNLLIAPRNTLSTSSIFSSM